MSNSTHISFYRWIILALLYFGMLVVTFVIQVIPPLLPQIGQALRLDEGQAGLLMGLVSLPGLILSIFSGSLSDRYGFKRVASCSLCLIVGGVWLMSMGGNLTILSAGRIISGIGVTALIIALPHSLVYWFRDANIGLAMGIFNTALPLGTILSYSFVGDLAEVWGWRTVMQLVAILAVVNLVLLFLIYHPLKEERSQPARFSISRFFHDMHLGKSVWLLAIIWMLYIAATMGFSTFGLPYFRNLGFRLDTAGFLTSIVTWGGLVFSPFAGYVLDRGVKGKWLLLPSCLGLAGAFLLLASGHYPLAVSLALLGVTAGLVSAPVYYLLPKIVSPKHIGLGYGVLMTGLSTGVLCGPWLTGWVDNRWPTFSAGFVLMAIFCFSATLVCLFFKPGKELTKTESLLTSGEPRRST